MTSSMSIKHIIKEEDLTKKDEIFSLVLRFKNCTGNTIKIDNSSHEITHTELTTARIAQSTDPKWGIEGMRRERTVNQAMQMVQR